MPKHPNPVAVVEAVPTDPADMLAELRSMRHDLKQTVLDPLASYLALPGILHTTARYYRDVIPVPFDLARIGLTTCVGTDDDGLWLIEISGEIATHGVRVLQVGPSLAFTLHQCAERAWERIDRLIAAAERDARLALTETAA